MTFLALTRSSAARAALDLTDVENIKAVTSMPNTYRPLRVDNGPSCTPIGPQNTVIDTRGLKGLFQ
ncbi:TPA: hypothetical protein ABHN85_23675 [Pseudomonas sp. H2]|uniref:hypothetical protein n=1 Tax=unclassified Pseudomonas TaxID=196821 RepID=UPI001269935B|nr:MULTISPECIES: hypothetical protein [unclassified Pseudomonas]UDU79297.1 hypothetical protein LJX93_16010 [Pseudomonas sp. HN2-3]